jgi:hypothetical protein
MPARPRVPGAAPARVATRYPAPTSRLPYLVYRATPRDRWLLRMLAEHQVLTAPQICALAFTSVRVANKRLVALTELGLLDRFRLPRAAYGNTPWQYVLGPGGAQLIAAERGLTVAQLGYQRAKLLAHAARADLPHTTGCHDTLVHLAARGRTPGTGRLAVWWSARSAATVWGDLIRPDAYALWQSTGTQRTAQECGFFYEHDTGTESLTQLLGKLPGYRRFRDQQDGSHPVLIHLPTAAREQRVAQELAADPPGVPVATTCVSATDLALGAAIDAPVWLPAGAAHRHSLGHLPAAFTRLGHRLRPPAHYDRDVYAPEPLPEEP